MKNNYAIIAVSGGPDSMYLLHKLMKKKMKIIVAHVNYHFRKESNEEEEKLKNYCKKNNIELEIMDVNNEVKSKYNFLKNKQHFAREIRYDFFVALCNKYQTEKIYIGHHKDDFIETAIMQEKRSTNLPFYGLKKISEYKEKKLIRINLRIYKEDILSFMEKYEIPYSIDKTNFSDLYERNKIRLNLSNKTKKQKNKIYKHYVSINKSNDKVRKKIEKKWIEWKKLEYSIVFFLEEDKYIQQQLIFKLLVHDENFIKINLNKVNSVISFLEKKNKKSFRLMEDLFLEVKDNKINMYYNKGKIWEAK